MNLESYINGLRNKKCSRPVSFSFHCEVGQILDENDEDIHVSTQEEKTLLPSNLIPFIP